MQSIEKQHRNIVLLGEKGHGKTTLTEAIAFYLAKRGKLLAMYSEKNATKVQSEMGTYTDYVWNEYTNFHMINHEFFDTAILVVSMVEDGIPKDQIVSSNSMGISRMIVFFNKCDIESKSDVEVKVRDLLKEFGYDEENVFVIYGSALKGIQEDPMYVKSMDQLIDAVDSWVPGKKEEGKTLSLTKK